ncbi:hypothetical protein [Micromonospora sp. NPDC049301]|uniref:hypothetical protein n=1 Tax=Micromonospora sp. NPDC049301 TaxID=3155723 RepID=UPI0034225B80
MARELGRSVVPPLHRPWDPDDSVDFHAARLLILFRRCGSQPRYQIEGRTKLAKLDFFVRYPLFLQRAMQVLHAEGRTTSVWHAHGAETEAPMIRYRFGPWDPRYRQYLAFLEARQLIRITVTKPERVSLTAAGRRLAEQLATKPSFRPIVERCDAMVGNLAVLTGTELKDLVYDLFPGEVGEAEMRAEIRQ